MSGRGRRAKSRPLAPGCTRGHGRVRPLAQHRPGAPGRAGADVAGAAVSCRRTSIRRSSRRPTPRTSPSCGLRSRARAARRSSADFAKNVLRDKFLTVPGDRRGAPGRLPRPQRAHLGRRRTHCASAAWRVGRRDPRDPARARRAAGGAHRGARSRGQRARARARRSTCRRSGANLRVGRDAAARPSTSRTWRWSRTASRTARAWRASTVCRPRAWASSSSAAATPSPVAKGVRERLDEIRQTLPEGMNLDVRVRQHGVHRGRDRTRSSSTCCSRCS